MDAQQLEQDFKIYWKQNGFPEPTEPLLLAVSGGKDSMALATILWRLGQPFSIAHCNFQLRAQDAVLDEQFVIQWAKEKEIECHTISFDTENEMKRLNMGVQETARKLRYDWFQSLFEQYHYAAICTAHHANDNVETLLINLCKGSGIAGLHGIPRRNNNIIRPLLFAHQKQILAYCAALQVSYRDDRSNESTKYLRNAIRHNVIPELQALFPDVVTQINESITRFRNTEILYQQAIAQHKKALLEKRGADWYLPILKLLKTPAYEAICYEIFSEFGFKGSQIPEILKLIEKSSSGHFIDGGQYRVIRDRMFLILTEKDTELVDLILVDQLPQTIETQSGRFCFSLLDNTGNFSTEEDCATISFDKLSLPLSIRKWRKGDYFYPLGMNMKKKKLSRFLIDQKIPLHQKEQFWIVAQKDQILWLVGKRIDERFKVKELTKKVLKIQFFRK